MRPLISPLSGSRRATTRCIWLFALTLIGYPIFGLLSSLLNVDSTSTSIAFRVGVVVLALLLLLNSLLTHRWWRQQRWLLAFWALYGARLVWDGIIAGQPGVPEALVFYTLAVLLPCTALGMNAAKFEERRALRLMILLGGTVCVGAVAMHTFGLGQARRLSDLTDRLFFEALNPISLGHAAVTTLIAVLCITRQRPNRTMLSFSLVVAAAAGACVVLSGSRGPMLALAVCVMLFAAAARRWVWLALVLLVLLPQMLNSDAELWQRFSTVTEDASALERLLLQGNAIQQFLAQPLLGSAYVELEFKEYPHNLIIETGMALGVLGLTLFLTIAIQALRVAAKQLRRGHLLVPLLFAQYLIGAQFSGAIWGASALWACTALLLGWSSFGSSTNRATRSVVKSRGPDTIYPGALDVPARQPSLKG